MEAENWLAKFHELIEASDWSGVDDLRKTKNEEILKRAAAPGLQEFYEHAASLELAPAQLEELQNSDIEPFRSGVRDLFEEAKKRLSSENEVKGIYLEYFYDGGDSCTADLYLCEEYSDDDDGWGAEFGADGDIQGPSVSAYFEFDNDYSWSNAARVFGNAYVDARLLAICVDEWFGSGIDRLPFAFAAHNKRMVRVYAA